MDSVFLICAAAGGTLLVCQFVAGLIGLGSDHDVDHGHGLDHDHGHGHGHTHGHGTSWFAGLITFRTVTAGLTFFGLGGMTALSQGADEALALAIAVLSGAAALYVVAQIMLGLKKLKSDGSVRVERAVGETGVVYLTVPAKNAGPGKVTVAVQKRTVQYTAYTAGADPLPTGAKVRVTAVRGPTTVEVEPVEVLANQVPANPER